MNLIILLNRHSNRDLGWQSKKSLMGVKQVHLRHSRQNLTAIHNGEHRPSAVISVPSKLKRQLLYIKIIPRQRIFMTNS